MQDFKERCFGFIIVASTCVFTRVTLHDVATMADGDVSYDALGRFGYTRTMENNGCE
jgi:hypothetical protein